MISMKTWKHTNCPNCNRPAIRETDTMDTFVDSSWYFIRFTDTGNTTQIASADAINTFLPVNTYVGGSEHATSHLLYSRFIYKFLQDIRIISNDLPREPFQRLITQGMVHGRTMKCPDTGAYLRSNQVNISDDIVTVIESGKQASIVWEKMSKSKFNGIEPQDMLDKYGIDIVRLYILAKAPPELVLDWNERDIVGQDRWLKKFWKLCCSFEHEREEHPNHTRIINVTNNTIYQVTTSLEQNQFHNAISFLIKFNNELVCISNTNGCYGTSFKEALKIFCILLHPMAPHITSEIWKELLELNNDIRSSKWPIPARGMAYKNMSDFIVQFNGKSAFVIPRQDLDQFQYLDDESFMNQVMTIPNVNNKVSEYFNNNPNTSIIKTMIIPGRRGMNIIIQRMAQMNKMIY